MSSSRNPVGRQRPKGKVWWPQKTLEGDREGKLPVRIGREGHKTGEQPGGGSPSARKPEAQFRALTGYLRKSAPWEKMRRAPGHQTPVPPTDGGVSLCSVPWEKRKILPGRQAGKQETTILHW